jgi:Lipid A 3-O-deacylase (PagL)
MVTRPSITAVCVFVIGLHGATLNAIAGEDDQPSNTFSLEDRFAPGEFELKTTGGAYFSPFGTPKSRPVINYTFAAVQIGYMLDQPSDMAFWRGNFEIAVEGFGSRIFDGPGSYITGMTLWGYYNFVPRGCRFVPFVEGGAGVTLTDIDHDIVGENFNFNLNLGAGVRYFISSSWSVNLEYRYQHISNAGLGDHNLGINAQGGFLSVSWLF